MALTQTQVSQLYISIFGRASEGAGNTYWQATADMATAANTMLATDAAATYFGTSLDTAQAFIEHIYLNTLGKTYAQDTAGVDYWVTQLATQTRGEVVAALVYAAQQPANAGAAQDMFNNKVAVSNYCADNIETADVADLSAFTGYISGVTDDDATVTTAQGAIAAAVTTGISFALTAGDDTKFGTAGNDTFTATSATYNAADLIADSSAGDTDVMTVSATGDITATPTIVGIETVNFTLDAFLATDASFDVAATNIAGASKIVLDSTKVGTSVLSGQVTALKSGMTVEGSSNLTTALIATLAGTAATTDTEAVTVTGSAATTTANSTAGDLTAATMTSKSAVAATFVTDSVGTATMTTTAADMVITAATATTVVATSAGSIDANTTDLLAATSVTLTAVDEIDAGLAVAVSATISAGGTTTSTIDDAVAGKLTTLSLSGNGTAHTFDITDSEAVKTVAITGTQNVTVVADAFDVAALTGGKITVTDSSSATSTLKLGTAAGTVDLTAAAVDVINLAVDNATKTATLASGAALTISVDQAGSTTLDGVDASAATNTLAVTLFDGTKSATATAGVDLATLVLTDFSAVTIDASSDDIKSTIAAITATADNTDVTINTGALGVTMTGAINLGTGDLTVNSNAAVTLTGSTVTAANVSVVGTGAVTWNTLSAATTANVTTGDGADVLTISNTNGNLVLATGAGNDSIDLSVVATAAKTISIDAGAGTLDTVIIAAANMTLGTSVTLSGVERLDFDTGAVTVDNSLLSGQSYIVTNIAAAGAVAITVALGTDTVSDLSTLAIDTAQLASGTDSFIVDGSAATSAVTLTGTLLDDTLTGSAYNDTLTGGAGADTIVAGAGNDTITAGAGIDLITAGAGADTIILTETTEAADVLTLLAVTDGSAVGVDAGTFTGFDVITGYGTTDSIDYNTNVGAGTAVANYVLGTLATVSANDLTASNYTNIDTVVNFLNDAGVNIDQNASEDTIVAVQLSSGLTAIYSVSLDAADATNIDANEIYLIGTVDAILTAADII